MATGLLALLDDVAAIAKVAAASLDDAAAQATKVGAKATGIVIDDAAVTPRYVVGFTADRELPIIGRIALGSLKNKLLFLLPGALLLSLAAPWIITPLLMLGGAYLCLEGYHKVHDAIRPHAPDADVDAALETLSSKELENEKVESAIRTDFILSAEIMAISLAAVAASPLWLQGVILAVVGVGMTALVYGAVALIVKADDFGAALASGRSEAGRAFGTALVRGMPLFLKALAFVGMIAMLWVGGGILVHGAAGLGWHGPEDAIHHWAETVAPAGPLHGFLVWFVTAAVNAVIGLAVGAVVAPVAERVIEPLSRSVRAAFTAKRNA